MNMDNKRAKIDYQDTNLFNVPGFYKFIITISGLICTTEKSIL
jgi:hypothetical protein